MSIKYMIASRIDEKYLKRIGEITVQFSLLEHSISMCIWKMMDKENDQDFGKIITSELSMLNLINLFSSLFLYLYKKEKLLSDLSKLLKTVNKANVKRNIIIHSIYLGNIANSDSIVRLKTTAKEKKGLTYQIETLSTKELDNITKTITDACSEVQRFYTQFILNNVGKIVESRSQL